MNTYKIELFSFDNHKTFTVEAKSEFNALQTAKERFKLFSRLDCHVLNVKRLKTRTEKILIVGSFALFVSAFVMTVLQLGG